MGRANTLWYCSFLLLIIAHAFLVPAAAKPSYASKIKHVVVLMEENRSFDHMFGWFKGVNGLNGTEYNLMNVSNPNSAKVYVNANGPFVAPCDPDHSTPATTYKIFGSSSDAGKPMMSGFVGYENMRGNSNTNSCAVMEMQSPAHVPIMAALSSNFVLMDRFFCAHPGPTWPNRLYMLSATSAGNTETGIFYQDKSGNLYPQKTIFDQVSAANLTWRNYYNDTPWELFLETIATHPENLVNMEQFYEDAKTGNLPAFSWINPRAGTNETLKQGSNDQHPDHDVALGERYYKDIYEALRSSPAWNETLYIVTYDEHGGFYDHVPPPLNVPAPDDDASYPDKGFLFNRLGIRIPTLLISPWLPKGMVVSGPAAAQMPASNSEYTLTSIMATARILLGIESAGPLTKRDAWSATFENLFEILDTPRTDCPLHLPDAPPPSDISEESLPVNDLQKTIMKMHAHLTGVEFPTHITRQGQVSEWLQSQYSQHAEYTTQWKQSKTSRSLSVSSSSSASEWRVNKGVHSEYITLSSKGGMCLDYNEDNGHAGVTPCYPRADPDSSLDPSQRWVLYADETLRPHSNPSLCLSLVSRSSYSRVPFIPSSINACSNKVALNTCNGASNQQWNFKGTQSGDIDIRAWNDQSLGVVATSSLNC